MSATLSPRSLDRFAYLRWLKHGAKLTVRSLGGWVPMLFLIVVLASDMILHSTLAWIASFLLSGILQGLNAAAAYRSSQGTPTGPLETLQFWWAELRAHPTAFRALFFRQTRNFILIMILNVFMVMVLPTSYINAFSNTHAVSNSSLWLMAILFFHNWVPLWGISVAGQLGGVGSMTYYLMTQHGASKELAVMLQAQAESKNLISFTALNLIFFISFFISLPFPLLIVPLQCFWASVLCCAYNDVFMGQSEPLPQAATAQATRHATA